MTKIHILPATPETVAERLADEKAVYVVHDRNVGAFARRIAGRLPGLQGIYSLSASEAEKNIDTVADICRWLLEKGAGRDAYVLGIGGGITTDITGFAASVYKRGVRFAFVPTTLLAQVDAAIGGKNGVNLAAYKNMMGVFRQPEVTFICAEALDTLPGEELLGGAAELLKSYLIDNTGDKYGQAVAVFSDLAARRAELPALAAGAAAVKAAIVERDEFESGERRHLNLGHTFAHAIEKVSDGHISHGRAGSMGILLAARLSEALGVAPAGLEKQLRTDFKACGLPVECPWPVSVLGGAMAKDKKAEGDAVRFVLLEGIGAVCTRVLSVSDVISILQ